MLLKRLQEWLKFKWEYCYTNRLLRKNCFDPPWCDIQIILVFCFFSGCRLQDDAASDGDVPNLPQLRRHQDEPQSQRRLKDDVIDAGGHHLSEEAGQPPRPDLRPLRRRKGWVRVHAQVLSAELQTVEPATPGWSWFHLLSIIPWDLIGTQTWTVEDLLWACRPR